MALRESARARNGLDGGPREELEAVVGRAP